MPWWDGMRWWWPSADAEGRWRWQRVGEGGGGEGFTRELAGEL